MKTNSIILILLGICCVLCLTVFGIYLVNDLVNDKFENGGVMFICLVLFWIFLFCARIISQYDIELENYPIPEEGRLIRITWLKHCRNVSSNVPNPYIGMIGRVRNLKPDGSFDLQCDTCWLIVITEYKFEYLD